MLRQRSTLLRTITTVRGENFANKRFNLPEEVRLHKRSAFEDESTCEF